MAGVLNVTGCECRVVISVDAPIVLSEPHFNEADSSYQHAVDGLSPNASYVTYIDVEPVSINRYYRTMSTGGFLLTLLVGRQEWHPACRKLVLVCWW